MILGDAVSKIKDVCMDFEPYLYSPYKGVPPGEKYNGIRTRYYISLSSWRDFARECFCFSSETVNASDQAVRGLVVHPLFQPCAAHISLRFS